MDALTLLLIFGGGVLAGVVNTVAGGGSIITLPLLIFAGLPPTMANGTNRVAIVFQNISALTSFKRRGFTVGRGAWLLLVPTLIGAYAGVRMAVDLDETTLRRIIGVVLVLMLIPVLRKNPAAREAGPVSPPTRAWNWPLYFLIGAYGGFLQVGVGFFYLALLSGIHGMDLIRANLIKVFYVLIFTILALGVFALEGQIDWGYGLILAVGNSLGGWLGAKMAVEKGERWIRAVLVLAILVAAARLVGLF